MPKPEEIYQRLRDKKVPLAIASSVLAVVLITAISLALLLPGDAGGGSTTSPGKQQEGDETTTSPSNPREKLGGGATVSPDVEGGPAAACACSTTPEFGLRISSGHSVLAQKVL